MNDMSPTRSAKIPVSALPATTADRIAWLRLSRSRRVGPATFIRLLREYGSANAAIAALPKIAADAGAKDYQAADISEVTAEFACGVEYGAKLLCLGEDAYPTQLSLIDDPPPVLWVKGRPAIAEGRNIAIVGARNASALGCRTAGKLTEELCELGFVITSGLARGIDTIAHKSALNTGTIAVLAGGLDIIYPQENAALMAQIAEQGLIATEMPMGMTPQARHFPRRNRIISGLSQAVVVVEGAARSGSLITARNALDQGREVMAIPGHPFDARASGCNMLIRDGATLVRSGADVAEALSIPVAPAQKPLPISEGQPPQQNPDAGRQQILNYLGPSPISEDALIRQTKIQAPALMEILSSLELDGKVERHAGGLVSLA